MVSRDEFLASVSTLVEAPCPPVKVEAFDALAFERAESEESIIIHRGHCADCRSVLHFWVKSLQSPDCQGRETHLLQMSVHDRSRIQRTCCTVRGQIEKAAVLAVAPVNGICRSSADVRRLVRSGSRRKI